MRAILLRIHRLYIFWDLNSLKMIERLYFHKVDFTVDVDKMCVMANILYCNKQTLSRCQKRRWKTFYKKKKWKNFEKSRGGFVCEERFIHIRELLFKQSYFFITLEHCLLNAAKKLWVWQKEFNKSRINNLGRKIINKCYVFLCGRSIRYI